MLYRHEYPKMYPDVKQKKLSAIVDSEVKAFEELLKYAQKVLKCILKRF